MMWAAPDITICLFFFSLSPASFMKDYCPDADRYGRPLKPLERSAPEMPMERLLEATAPAPAFPFDPETDMSVGGGLAEAVDWVLDKIAWLFG
jgi:beta-amylase